MSSELINLNDSATVQGNPGNPMHTHALHSAEVQAAEVDSAGYQNLMPTDAVQGMTCPDEGCPHYGTPHSHPDEQHIYNTQARAAFDMTDNLRDQIAVVSTHVHGPDCNHEQETIHDELSGFDIKPEHVTPQSRAEREQIIQYLTNCINSRDRALNNVSINELRAILKKADKGTRKKRLGDALMLPTITTVQLRLMFGPKDKQWEGLDWLPLMYSQRLIQHFIHQETQRSIVAASANFPLFRAKLLAQAPKMGIIMNVDEKALDRELAKTELMCRNKNARPVVQDIFDNSKHPIQRPKLSFMQVMKALKIELPTAPVAEVANEEHVESAGA